MAAVVFAEAVEALARVAVALVDAHLGRRAGVRLAEVELRKERAVRSAFCTYHRILANQNNH